MPTTPWTFPFGQPVRDVIQTDCTPKQVFVLGVYSSAVHARWIDKNGKTVVNALAVASEPYIFWRGEDAEAIIGQIDCPPALGKLVPANRQLNGPSGIALDERILHPLGLERSNVWLCDLVPHSCTNPNQLKAIKRAYETPDHEKAHQLPKCFMPPVPKKWTDEKRRQEILAELIQSGASTLILLGDLPIRWFLHDFDPAWEKLSDFGVDGSYGSIQTASLCGKAVKVLALAHPKQIGRLGPSSTYWFDQHQAWLKKDLSKLLMG